MRKNWVRVAFMIVGLVLSYLLNNLPVVSDDKKPWVLPGVLVLTTVAAWLTTKDSNSTPRPPQTVAKDRQSPPEPKQVEDIDVKGKGNEMIVEGKSTIKNLKVDGDGNKFDIGGTRSSGGKNP